MVFFSNKHKNPPTIYLEDRPLKYSNQVKFLGVIFDKRMTWKPHIKSLNERCAKDLRLLNIISYQGWGADFLTLKRIYTALILSKITYGSCLFHTAAPTNLTILNRIQYSAARIMLGALRCTKLEKLEVTANLLPLKQCWEKYTLKYAQRALSISQHPIRQLLIDYYPMTSYQLLRRTQPIIARMYDSLKNLKIEIQDTDHYPQEYRYRVFNLPVSDELHICAKENLSNTVWVAAYKDLCTKYQGYSFIFTDGSKTDENVGGAVWNQSFKLQAKLPLQYSLFEVPGCSCHQILSQK